ncbi:MAG: sugar ABC transporter ATP-binding protein [Spirochaetaceae bacterium]|jgi:methyl-galactoside transport system ATP-binding protein/inositol transport system ATP-binding protein|nr:sugar ABC transporter ATP-binding protein [Spirochaetaceae bacterium]
MRNIVKTFPGVQALRGVDLKVRPGEIHALMGENGAGKSTLMKCIAGIHRPTSGEIFFDGQVRGAYNPSEALKMGISMIHQELSPVLYRPIMENIWLGREPLTAFALIDHKKMYEMTKDVLKIIELEEDPSSLMVSLTVAKMQMVEIAKAVSFDSKLVIMDEPTSALTDKEVKQLFDIMRKLKSQGKSIIFISHKLDEVYEIADRITVYRDGMYIGSENAGELKVDRLINMMVGRDVNELFPKVPCPIGDVRLEVKNLSNRKYFRDVSFTVRKGEIFGIAGLVGAGRTEVVETIFGMRPHTAGEVFINGKKADIKSPRDAIRCGMAWLTEDRRGSGIFPMLSVQLNIAIATIPRFLNRIGLIRTAQLNESCEEYVKKIQVKTPSLAQHAQNLSGGNQQKVLVARWLMTNPDILFLDEPTRGIDVGTKSEIHRLITNLAGEGKSIVMISSELPEVMGMSDRIMVMHQGKVTGIVDNTRELTQEELMAYATDTVEEYKKTMGGKNDTTL